MIEKTGLLASTTDKFRSRPTAEWTLDELFKTELKLGNQERIRRLTASDAGYHGAHNAILVTPPPNSAAATTATTINTPPTPAQHVSVEGGRLYHCWSHGLSQNRNHMTSAICLNKATGHINTATAFRMQGGNNTISTGDNDAFLLLPADVAGSLRQASQILL